MAIVSRSPCTGEVETAEKAGMIVTTGSVSRRQMKVACSRRLHIPRMESVKFEAKSQDGPAQCYEGLRQAAGNCLTGDTYQGPPVVVIGAGRVGRALAQMAGGRAVVVRRGERVPIQGGASKSGGDSRPFPAFERGPILVATHNSDLSGVLSQTPRERWCDLVFCQNGVLQPWLYSHGLENNTQVLLYMSASPADQSTPDGIMRVEDGGGLSLAWGRWAEVTAGLLRAGRVGCTATQRRGTFNVRMVEKLLWSSIFWLLSAAKGGVPVGCLVQEHLDDVRALVSELMPATTALLEHRSFQLGGHGGESGDTELRDLFVEASDRCGVVNGRTALSLVGLSDGEEYTGMVRVEDLVDRLCEYSLAIPEAVPSKAMALREFEWRNGWFISVLGVTPHHGALLEKVGALACALPNAT